MGKKLTNVTVLIVDDEALTRSALKVGVHWQDIGVGTVLEAGTVNRAKEILSSCQVDLALIDIEMPGETGIDLMEWIRNDKALDIPCAFLTCHASFSYAQEAVRYRCYEYMLKPVNYEKVEELVQRMIGHSVEAKKQEKIAGYGLQWLKEREEAGKGKEKTNVSTQEIIENTIVHIRAHLTEKLTLSDLSHSVGLNPNYFNKIFKERTGKPVNQFIIQEKMALAAELLKQKNVKSYAIAELLGYSDYANFANMFKKIYGMSPNVYVETNKE